MHVRHVHCTPVSSQVCLSPEPRLVPHHDHVDASPSYAIVGGLVFLELSLPLVEAGLFEAAVTEPSASGYVLSRLGAKRKTPDEAVLLRATHHAQIPVRCLRSVHH